MAIFGKKTQDQKKATVQKPGKEEKVLKVATLKDSKEKRIALAWGILRRAHITEKATNLSGKNRYVFNVFKNANKDQIKKSVVDIYGVNVVSVNIINIPAKKRRMGRTQGWRQGYRKAIVEIKKGQEIELMPR